MADNVTKIGFGEEFDKEPEYSLIDDGNYEVVISKVEPKEIISKKNGQKYKMLNLTFKIRSDVEQEFKGRCIFYTIFGREGDEYYDYRVVNKIIMTQLEKGEKLFLNDVDEVLQYLQNLKLIVSVTSEFDTTKGEDRNVIVEDSFKASNHKEDTTVAPTTNTEPAQTKGESPVPADDDLPWMN